MPRIFLLATAVLLAPVPALADPGHIAAAGGHDHWVAGAAIALAAGIALWNTLRDRKRAAGDEAVAEEGGEPEPEQQEA